MFGLIKIVGCFFSDKLYYLIHLGWSFVLLGIYIFLVFRFGFLDY